MNSDQFTAIYGAVLELKILAQVFIKIAEADPSDHCAYTCDTESAKKLLATAIAADSALDELQRASPADEQRKSEVSA